MLSIIHLMRIKYYLYYQYVIFPNAIALYFTGTIALYFWYLTFDTLLLFFSFIITIIKITFIQVLLNIINFSSIFTFNLLIHLLFKFVYKLINYYLYCRMKGLFFFVIFITFHLHYGVYRLCMKDNCQLHWARLFGYLLYFGIHLTS